MMKMMTKDLGGIYEASWISIQIQESSVTPPHEIVCEPYDDGWPGYEESYAVN